MEIPRLEWRLIETAPKNAPHEQEGEHILLYFPEMGMAEGWWFKSHPEDAADPNEGWMLLDGCFPGDNNLPTHWAILPDDPTP